MKKLILDDGLEISVANSFSARLRGLLGSSCLPKNKGLLIVPCNSVHMIGMRYAIDVVYFDKDGRIIKIVENVRPWLGCSICLKAESALEIAAGMVKEYGWEIGQKII